MAEHSKIEWTDATWTPIRARNKASGKVGWHCTHKSPGCENCYSEGFNLRLGTGLPFKPGHETDVDLFLDETMLAAPLRWRKPRMIFVCSMTDLFADFVPDSWIDRVFAVMALAPQHTFQVLTKRAKRMRAYFAHDGGFGRWGYIEHQARKMADIPPGKTLAGWGESNLPNVWLGVSVEDQQRAGERVPDLLATPAAVRFVSAEPLLGPVDLRRIDVDGYAEMDALRPASWREVWEGDWSPEATGLPLEQARADYVEDGGVWPPTAARPPGLDWVIAGYESGPRARFRHPDLARSLRDQCADAGVPFHFKQWGNWLDADQLLDRIERGAGAILRGGAPWRPARPLNHADAAFLATLVHRPFVHHSDGTTALRMDKAAAGRLLDGAEHNGRPLQGSVARDQGSGAAA